MRAPGASYGNPTRGAAGAEWCLGMGCGLGRPLLPRSPQRTLQRAPSPGPPPPPLAGGDRGGSLEGDSPGPPSALYASFSDGVRENIAMGPPTCGMKRIKLVKGWNRERIYESVVDHFPGNSAPKMESHSWATVLQLTPIMPSHIASLASPVLVTMGWSCRQPSWSRSWA